MAGREIWGRGRHNAAIRGAGLVAGTIVLIAVIIVLWKVNPVEAVWMPKCVVHSLTGWQCPGCGITRALHAALHGHFAEAIRYNYFLLLSLPYLLAVAAVSWIPALRRRRRLHRVVLGPELAVSYVVLFAIWFVVRNLLGI
ncbi:MAG: DUF2752 domain-containing protein [Muribaculaceae bacterium]|nr:DUF2752 domain-containing protein [Muribaculaceae bacterium]